MNATTAKSRNGWKGWFRKLFGLGHRNELMEVIHDAEAEDLIDPDTVSMMEGALLVSEMKVRDIMVPSSQMVSVVEDQAPADFLSAVLESGHSRFPVYDDKQERIIGILLAKDLLPLAVNGDDEEFELRDTLRPAVFVPESKRLNILLREFRSRRNHLAIVVDEYGETAGLVSIEDVLAQIVGEIDDEHDVEDEGFIRQHRRNRYSVKGRTPIEEFNDFFEVALPRSGFDTIGGLVIDAFGHLPQRGEKIELGGFEFKVLRADRRRIHVMRVIPGVPSSDG